MKPYSSKSQTVVRLPIIMICVLLCVCFFGQTAVYASASDVDLRYEASGSQLYTETVYPTALITAAGGTPTASESEYLGTFENFILRYNAQIPDGYVTVSGVATTVTVSAKVYSYTALNNKIVTWTPVEAVSEGKTITLVGTGNTYTGTFENMDADTSHSVRVNYTMTIQVPATIIEVILNRAYIDGTAALGQQNAYEAVLSQHQTNTAAYQAYLVAKTEYETASAAYQDYEVKLAAYQAAYAAWQTYQSEYSTYLVKKQEYDSYMAALTAYNNAVAALEAERLARADEFLAYANYLAYLEEAKACSNKLFVLDNIFCTSSEGHQMYATLTGGTVSVVLDRKQELIDYGGVSEADIDNAGNSTEALINLLSAYRTLSTDKERYEWYVANYTSLKDNFLLLYSSLYSLFQNVVVKGALGNQGKYERYCQFVAHLYMISTCLDDSHATDSSWSVNAYRNYPAYTLSEALEADLFVTDRNAASPTTSWPVVMPEATAPVMETIIPAKPATTVFEPLMPTTVTEPTAPTAVSVPTAPSVVAEPGAAPIAPVFSQTMKAIMSDIQSETITRRESRNVEITRTASVSKLLSAGDIKQYPTVTFLDNDGTLIAHVILIETSAVNGIKASIPQSDRIEYTFVGWTTIDGKKVDFDTVHENITVYPKFTSGPKTYQITWETAKARYITVCPYGQIPACNGDCEKPADERAVYRFIGWNKPITAAYSDAKYVAVYDETVKTYTITWNVADKTYATVCTYGSMPTFTDAMIYREETAKEYYEFIGWDRELQEVTGDATYTAVFRTQWLVPAEVGAESAGLTVQSNRTEHTVSVPNGTHKVNISYLLKDAANTGRNVILSFENGVTLTIPKDSLAGAPYQSGITAEILFDVYEGAVFSCRVSFETADGTPVYITGAQLCFACETEDGILYYGYAAGLQSLYGEYPVYMSGANAVFKLDGQAVNFALVAHDPDADDRYTVNFYLDDVLYATGTYHFNDPLNIPEDPTKVSTADEAYDFSGWSPTVIPMVVGNADYHGTFKASPIAHSSDYVVSPYTSRFPVKLLFVVLCVLLIAGVGIFLFFHHKKTGRWGVEWKK